MSVAIKIDHVCKKYGDNIIIPDLTANIKNGEFFTLLGPSGCGKTTLLRMIAGFNSIEAGTISFGDQVINELPTHQRNIGMVFQSYAIFPHLTVRQNVEYGLKIRKLPRDEMKKRVDEMLKLVRIDEYQDRLPERLSGGQQQRVAIARALVNHPKILLLDEPLGALDLKLRKDMQTELRKIQQALELTFVYVTHDQEEALTMSDTVVVMNNGHIQQIGSPIDIYNEPVNAFVADFIGESNIVNGCMPRDCLVEFAGKKFECVDKGFGRNEMVDVVIRPEDVKVIPAEQAQLTGIVESVVFKGVHYEMTVDCVDHKWLIHSTKAEPVGSVIGMTVDPFDIHIMKKSKQPGSYPALMGVNDNEEA